MRLSAIETVMIASMVAGLAGCQSGPRWAWWKHDRVASETAVAESAAAPSLPSEGAAPQAVAVAALEPVASPSAANLAATGVPTGIPAVSMPAPSSVPGVDIASTPGVGMPTSATAAAVPQSTAVAGTPSAGPYDPNGYQPVTTPSAPSATIAAEVPVVGDRYAAASPSAPLHATGSPVSPVDARTPVVNSPPSNMATETGDRYATTAAALTSTDLGNDRYGQAVTDRSTSWPVTDVATSSPPTVSTPAPTVTESAPLNATAANSKASVQLASPAGQYRPGGTSSYTGTFPADHVEVATRPASPASTQLPPQSTLPAGTSDPWAPPATSVPAGGVGTRIH